MSYFVYENWRADNKAKIHKGSCSFCNYGKGIHVQASSTNGKWSKPFASLEEAMKYAKSTGRKVSLCNFCQK